MNTTANEPSGETLVRVERVSKKFCRSLRKSLWYGLKDVVGDLSFGQHTRQLSDTRVALREDEFWAVDEVSFEVRRGECLGLIGQNGAGKTTLLKLLNGLIKPDHGRIEMWGNVGALIALGAGFSPILTGRENVLVNGAILGLSRADVEAKMEAIIAFAEIGPFIDAPVQTYSSGMVVRLGFAVAVMLIQPDVLILDEVLAVGDVAFIIKCLNAVRELASKSAVILVSHNMQLVSAFCTRVMYLEHGRCLVDGTHPADAIDRYYATIVPGKQISGTGGVTLHGARWVQPTDSLDTPVETINTNSTLEFLADLEIEGTAGVEISVHILDQSLTAEIISFPLQNQDGSRFVFPPGRMQLRVPCGALELAAGKYSVMLAVLDSQTRLLRLRQEGLCPFSVRAPTDTYSRFLRPVSNFTYSPH